MAEGRVRISGGRALIDGDIKPQGGLMSPSVD